MTMPLASPKNRAAFALTLVALLLVGCGRSTSPETSQPAAPATSPPRAPASGSAPASASRPPSIAPLPVTLRVGQRSTTIIPGSREQLSLTIDDITRGQVIVSISGPGGTPVLGPTSLSNQGAKDFEFDSRRYRLTLTRLDNELIGEDVAQFEISAAAADSAADAEPGLATDPAGPAALSEPQKIERLIAAVAGLSGAAFVRNGADHSAAEAAEHLREKLAAAGDGIRTARDFIDRIGSKSSLSGAPYHIRRSDGTTETAREFLLRELWQVEGVAPPNRAPSPPQQ